MTQSFFEQRQRRILYQLIEFSHAAIGDKRFVNKQFADKTFRIDGVSKTFQGAQFVLTMPEISDSDPVIMQVQLGRVGSNIKQYVKQINTYRKTSPNVDPVVFTYYQYLDGDLNYHQTIQLWVSNIAIDGDSVAIRMADDNASGINCARLYDAVDFPGLKVIS